MKRGLHDIARSDIPAWEPEPLHAPVPERGPQRRDDPRAPRSQPDDARDDERAGSHVIVIDLA